MTEEIDSIEVANRLSQRLNVTDITTTTEGIRSIEVRIKEAFAKGMKHDKCVVFSNVENYLESLPRRLANGRTTNEIIALYTKHFWAEKESIERMALGCEICENTVSTRNLVRYTAAPTANGKTASVLPAFLNSFESNRAHKFTHYLYIAFSNNGRKNFRFVGEVTGDKDLDLELQGASFMKKCLEMYFNGEYGAISSSDISTSGDIQKEIETLIKEATREDSRCLIHLDEHRCMLSDRVSSSAARFRKGALETLAFIPNVVVITTFIKIPTEISSEGSSGTCRYPVSIPKIGLDDMAKSEKCFDIKVESNLTGAEKDLLSVVRFRLGQKLYDLGLVNLHIQNAEMTRFRERFQKILFETMPDTRDRFVKLAKFLVRDPSLSLNTSPHQYAADLLIGVPDREIVEGGKVPDITVTVSGLITTNLSTQLTMTHPNMNNVYNEGRLRFLDIFEQDTKFLSGASLETAYLLVLSTRSATKNNLTLGLGRFAFRCEELEGGRIFPSTNFRSMISICDVEQLKETTMYYVLEGQIDGSTYPTHPLCDIYFLTKKKQLVIIDITGCNDQDISLGKPVQKKIKRMVDWIKWYQKSFNAASITLHGVIMAPFDKGESSNERIGSNLVSVQRDKEAIFLLGGLAQLLDWSKSG